MLGKFILVALSAVSIALAGIRIGVTTPVGDRLKRWVQYNPDFIQHECEGGKVKGDYFSIPKSPNGENDGAACSDGRLRAERRYKNDYSTGMLQFGGKFIVNSMTGTRIAIKQAINGEAGPYYIMGVESNGRLYDVESCRTIADNIARVGSVVRINTIHDTKEHRYSIWVNGKESFNDECATGGSFYDKLGAYTTINGTGSLNITWYDVKFWYNKKEVKKGGRSKHI